MNEVLIDLSASKDAIALDKKNLIHQKEFQEAQRWVDSMALKMRKDGVQSNHDTITILGTRGSGKTTFLKTLIKEYQDSEELAVLQLIDPTLIEEKGHIFLTIISAINLLVEEKFRKIESNPSNLEFRREDYEKDLYRLAHGLPSIDGIGMTMQEASWQDPEFIMQNGLRSVASALELNNNFRLYINHSLKVLNKSAFIIAFDDIDIDFRKGWPVLEMIRKYFTSSKIITLLSGDLRLYSLAIRKQHWTNFGKALLINEAESFKRMPYFNDRVTEMEGQYMLKVLKPEKRIHLSTLYEKTRIIRKFNQSTNENKILVKLNEEEIEITIAYKQFLKRFGISNNYQAEAYSSFLLGLPLRTQIQFISEYEEHYSNLDEMNVMDSFLSDLIEKKVDVNLLESTPKLLNVEILRLLLREKELADVYQLQPITSDASLNGSLFSLSLLFSQKIYSNPYLIFDYFIKIGYVRNQLTSLQYLAEENSNSLLVTPSIEGFCKHSGVYQDKVLRDIAGNMTAYLRGAFTNTNLWGGVIPLLGLGTPAKQEGTQIADRIDIVFRNQPKEKMVLGFIPLSICAFITRNQTIPCYSVYTLLATIGEIMRKVEEDDLERGLSELSQVRTYLIPEFRKRINEGNESSLFLDEGSKTSNEDLSLLSSSIKEWVNGFPHQSAVSPHLLGKISTRFFYALKTIEDSEEVTNLGDMMNSRIIALLNAILLEDARENVQDFQLYNINNPNLSDKVFIQNLKASLGENRKMLTFSYWMLSCPLFLCYLKPGREILHAIRAFIPLGERGYTSNLSVYRQLLEVSVKGNRQLREDGRGGGDSNYYSIIETLKERGIPHSLFVNSDDRSTVLENNRQIRELFNEFRIPGEWNSPRIRRFRNYLQKKRIKW